MKLLHWACCGALALPAAAQHRYHELELAGGESLSYAVGLPADYDAQRSYPVMLALPPGRQDREMVEAGFARYWGEPARDAGWVVVSPVAPAGEMFFRGAERHLPALVAHIRENFRVAGGGLHLVGPSNGGRSAFRLAVTLPYQFRSVTVLPGYPPDDADVAALHRMARMRIRMFVGGDDSSWLARSEETLARLRELGANAELTVFDGEGHTPASLDHGVLMQHMIATRAATVVTGPTAPIALALDDLHDAASKADEDRYFGLFAPEAVFLGTDASERWTLNEFRAFAAPYFEGRSAWTYVPLSRRVTLRQGSDVAWFDEELGHDRYGLCRGTGVVRNIDGAWRVAQYNLSVPVPNELMASVVANIRAFEDHAGVITTTVFLVRHAEKEASVPGSDPPLSETGRARARALAKVLRDAKIDTVFHSEYRRTAETVAPLCSACGIEPTVVPAARTGELVAKIRAHRSGNVLVAGHSNTVPEIIRALGWSGEVAIGDDDYGELFVVSPTLPAPRLLRLRFGN